MQKSIIIISIIFLFNSCNKDLPTPPLIIDAGSKLKISSISPSIAKPGFVLTITGSGFDSTHYKNLILFNGGISAADSGSPEKLFTTVPFYAKSGIIKVVVKNDTAVGPAFNVVPIDTNGLNITTYSGPTFTERDSYFIDWLGNTVKWKAVKTGDTLTLSQGGICGDECNQVKTIKFYNNINDTLPHTVLAMDSIRDFWPDYKIDTLKGFVEFQDWNINSIVSGKVKVYDDNYWWSFIFWYNFNQK